MHGVPTLLRLFLQAVRKTHADDLCGAGPLARAAAVAGDEYASHVTATGALVRNQALVVGGRCDAQQLVHRVLAARARHAAIRSAGISHSSSNSWATGNPARVA